VGRFDAAARLADGRLAVERTQDYVWACHVLGYQHPDLTVHDSQVRDWYDSEDGLDLCALDDDCVKLRAAVHASEQALAMQRAQLAELAAAWTGMGANAAMEVLQRHCDSGSEVTAAVRAAAERCAALRDDLWRALDAKVAAAMSIDDRRLAERPAWLSAAQSVKSGTDEELAQDLVEQRIKPYVDNDIRIDWLTAMRSALASVDAVFDTVIDALAVTPPVCFETPGKLGGESSAGEAIVPMTRAPGEPAAASAPAPPANTMPAAVTPLAPMPATLPADLLDGLPPVPPLSDWASPLGDSSAGMSAGTGNFGGLGGLGSLAGSVAGIVGNIVDGIGGLIASLTDGLGDPSESSLLGDPLDDASEVADGPDDGEPVDQGDQPDDITPEESSENPLPTADLDDQPVQEPTAPPMASPPAAPGPEPAPPAEPPPPAPSESEPDASTPCEIAADELPQAGR
jgi:hypothetical protein